MRDRWPLRAMGTPCRRGLGDQAPPASTEVRHPSGFRLSLREAPRHRNRPRLLTRSIAAERIIVRKRPCLRHGLAISACRCGGSTHRWPRQQASSRQARLASFLVVVAHPPSGRLADVAQASEQVLVPGLLAEGPLEALDVGVLLGLAGLDRLDDHALGQGWHAICRRGLCRAPSVPDRLAEMRPPARSPSGQTVGKECSRSGVGRRRTGNPPRRKWSTCSKWRTSLGDRRR